MFIYKMVQAIEPFEKRTPFKNWTCPVFGSPLYSNVICP